MKRSPYVLFAMTPSERAAIGLTEAQVVHLLVRSPDGDWRLRHEWDGNRFSHTEFMAAWQCQDEPADPDRLLEPLPRELR